MITMRDPACGRLVTDDTAQAATEYQGRRYLFCSRGCKTAFERDPEACLAGIGLARASQPSGMGRWVCRREAEPEKPVRRGH